jgi:hypothetical protein
LAFEFNPSGVTCLGLIDHDSPTTLIAVFRRPLISRKITPK